MPAALGSTRATQVCPALAAAAGGAACACRADPLYVKSSVTATEAMVMAIAMIEDREAISDLPGRVVPAPFCRMVKAVEMRTAVILAMLWAQAPPAAPRVPLVAGLTITAAVSHPSGDAEVILMVQS